MRCVEWGVGICADLIRYTYATISTRMSDCDISATFPRKYCVIWTLKTVCRLLTPGVVIRPQSIGAIRDRSSRQDTAMRSPRSRRAVPQLRIQSSFIGAVGGKPELTAYLAVVVINLITKLGEKVSHSPSSSSSSSSSSR